MRLLRNIKHRGSDTWHDQKVLQQNLWKRVYRTIWDMSLV